MIEAPNYDFLRFLWICIIDTGQLISVEQQCVLAVCLMPKHGNLKCKTCNISPRHGIYDAAIILHGHDKSQLICIHGVCLHQWDLPAIFANEAVKARNIRNEGVKKDQQKHINNEHKDMATVNAMNKKQITYPCCAIGVVRLMRAGLQLGQVDICMASA